MSNKEIVGKILLLKASLRQLKLNEYTQKVMLINSMPGFLFFSELKTVITLNEDTQLYDINQLISL